jgi:tetratricopeptide (TPR) repeat protein
LQALTREGRVAHLNLMRFTPDETLALAQLLSPAHPQPLAEWLTRASEGNPYILVELVRHARANGLLLPDGTLNPGGLSASPVVPQTVYTLIQSRLAQLSEAARRVLDVAVAVGREFEFEVVARAAALSEETALDALDELRGVGLIYPSRDDPSGRLYTFDHSLTMEVAYREIGDPRHRLLHRRVAEAMERLYRPRPDSVAGQLAQHFAEGDEPQRAAPYAYRAGQLAARLAAWAEAIAFYEQALSADWDDAKRAEILMALGEAHFQAGQPAQASETYRAALTLAQSGAQAPDLQADAVKLALAGSLFPQARFAEAIALAQQVRAAGRPEIAEQAEFIWGAALSLEGADLAGAAEHLKKAEALLRQRRGPVDAARLAQIKFELGSVSAQQGDLHQAVALYREALAAAREEDGADTWVWCVLAHNNLAYHLLLLGDPTAIEYARAGAALAQEKGTLTLLTYLYSTLGEIALAANDLEGAEGYFAEGLGFAERFSMPERIAGLTANLGLVARQRGDTTLAVHRLSTALARADTLGTRHLAAQIRIWLAPLLPPTEARTHLAEARALAESGGRRRLLDEIARLELEIGG